MRRCRLVPPLVSLSCNACKWCVRVHARGGEEGCRRGGGDRAVEEGGGILKPNTGGKSVVSPMCVCVCVCDVYACFSLSTSSYSPPPPPPPLSSPPTFCAMKREG